MTHGSRGDAVPSLPAVLIFRKRILRWAETFIAAQGAAMRRHRPVFVGLRRDPSGEAMLGDRLRLVLDEHSAMPQVERALMTLAGRVPRRWLAAMRATGPRLVHAHYGSSTAQAQTIARALSLPLLVTYHGGDASTEPRSAADAKRRQQAFAAADRIIAVSRFVREALERAGCPSEKIVTHHIGVDTTRFAPAGAPPATPEVLFVGRLVPMKGCIHLLRAMVAVRERIPQVGLTVAGEGPLLEELQREAATLRLSVRFVGRQTQDQVRALMAGATVLAAPSITAARADAEGLPITLLEAQASGLPVVASTSGGVAEGVVDGETGFLFAPGDEQALALHLTTILGDPARRARMAAAARQHVETHFDLARQTATLEALYDTLAAERR